MGDLEAFVSALEAEKGARPNDLKVMKDAVRSNNMEKFATVLRKLSDEETEKLMYQHASQTQASQGWEVANTSDPLMGNERRVKADCWISCYDHTRYGDYDMIGVEPIVRGRPKDMKKMSYSTIELGYDADKWEQSLLFHSYVYDQCNIASDVAMEANGLMRLDGRILGDRFDPKKVNIFAPDARGDIGKDWRRDRN